MSRGRTSYSTLLLWHDDIQQQRHNSSLLPVALFLALCHELHKELACYVVMLHTVRHSTVQCSRHGETLMGRERDPRVRSLKVSEPLLNCSVVFSDRPGGWDACWDAGTLLAHTIKQVACIIQFAVPSVTNMVAIICYHMISVLICISWFHINYKPTDSLGPRTSKDHFNQLDTCVYVNLIE